MQIWRKRESKRETERQRKRERGEREFKWSKEESRKILSEYFKLSIIFGDS